MPRPSLRRALESSSPTLPERAGSVQARGFTRGTWVAAAGRRCGGNGAGEELVVLCGRCTLSTGSASLDAADRADERLRRERRKLLQAEAPAAEVLQKCTGSIGVRAGAVVRAAR